MFNCDYNLPYCINSCSKFDTDTRMIVTSLRSRAISWQIYNVKGLWDRCYHGPKHWAMAMARWHTYTTRGHSYLHCFSLHLQILWTSLTCHWRRRRRWKWTLRYTLEIDSTCVVIQGVFLTKWCSYWWQVACIHLNHSICMECLGFMILWYKISTYLYPINLYSYVDNSVHVYFCLGLHHGAAV